MTNENLTDENEAPLDPAFEKVRRKMVRMLIVSSSVIVLGLMAVVFSVVYRVNKLPPAETPVATVPSAQNLPVPAAQQTVTLPEGFVVKSSSISGNLILIYGASPDGRQHFIVHDIGTGKRVTEIDVN